MSQTYRMCEIAQNNGKDGKPVWIVIKGSVYDVTKFVDEHPGGPELIMEFAGKEATKAFNEVGHSTDAIKELKLYKIGVVANECKSTSSPSTAQTTTTTTTIITTTDAKQQQLQNDAQKKRMKFFFCL